MGYTGLDVKGIVRSRSYLLLSKQTGTKMGPQTNLYSTQRCM